MTAQRKLLTVDEVAEQISLSRWTVIKRIREREAGDPLGLPATNVAGDGTGTRYRIDPDDLKRWLEARRVAA